LVQKTLGFLKFIICPHGQGGRGIEPVMTFCGEENRDQFFAILCGRLLWTVSYSNVFLYTLTGTVFFLLFQLRSKDVRGCAPSTDTYKKDAQ